MSEKKIVQILSRRHFLALGAGTLSVGLLAACAQPAQPAPTQAAKDTAAATAAPAASATKAPAATAAASATKAATAAAGTPKKGGTLTLAQPQSISEFSPARPGSRHSIYLRALFNTLIQYDDKLQPQPDLAEKWAVAPDGKSITLNLRQGVKFHSGREFTSQDVKNTVEFLTTPEAAAVALVMFKGITAVETPDKYTVTLRFANTNPGMFDILDMLYIIDKETIANRGSTANGTGPFKINKYVPNDHVELVAFPDYWDKGKPYLEKVIIRIVPDTPALAINLESGAIDVAFTPSFPDLVRLKDAGGKYVIDMGAASTNVHDIAINCAVKPYDDKRVRQAISMCIDRDRFCKTILQGLVQPTTLIWPPTSWAYFKDLEGKMGYDLTKAQALLKEAGLEKGFDTEILVSAASNYGHDKLAQILQADLKKVNINAKVVDVDATQRVARENKKDVVLLVHSYGRANRDPGTTLVGTKAYMNGKEGSYTNFESADYDRLRVELQSTLDQAKRKETIRKLQELLLDGCFTIPVSEAPLPWAYVKALKGFKVTADNAPFLGDMWLER
ncbi:MAG: ABC transporter substrate-binding protein [Chloroflexota bacterium]